MSFSDWFRRTALNVLTPVTEWVGALHVPDSHKLITEADFAAVKRIAQPGMVLLTRIEGEASSLLIPGFYTHAALVIGAQGSPDGEIQVVQATRSGVTVEGLPNFMFSKDFCCLLKPTFATAEEMAAAAAWATLQAGKPYDWDFMPPIESAAGLTTPTSFYCSKLVWAAYLAACGPNVPFTLRNTLGVPTVIPDDIDQAKTKFQELCSNRPN